MKNVENFSRTPHRREEEDDSTTKPDFLHNTVMRTNQFYQPRSIRQMASRYATVEQKKSPEFGGKIEYDSENSDHHSQFLTPLPEQRSHPSSEEILK
jgi:hypothetical protein